MYVKPEDETAEALQAPHQQANAVPSRPESSQGAGGEAVLWRGSLAGQAGLTSVTHLPLPHPYAIISISQMRKTEIQRGTCLRSYTKVRCC